SLIVSSIGYISFTTTLKREYRDTTYRMGITARGLIDGDLIDTYRTVGDYSPVWQNVNNELFNYCNNMDITLLYVYQLDTSDYMHAYSIFDEVNDAYKKTGPDDTDPTHYSGREYAALLNKEEHYNRYYDIYKDIYEGKIKYGTVYRTKDLGGREPHLTIVVPVYDSERNVTAVLSVQRPMRELVKGRRPYMITLAISTILTLMFVCTTAGIFIKRQFVKPLKYITDETKRFAKENKKSEFEFDKNSKITEIVDLSKSIEKMEDDMIKYINDLTQATTAQKKTMVELNIAKDIQESSIPNVFPERKDFDLFAYMLPAKEVGGDFYNFVMIDDTHIGLVMADVSGKGIPAALFMMASNILLSERIRIQSKPSEALEFLNSRICLHNKTNMFVTVWVGILDLTTGHVVACNAGHDDPVICRKKKNFEINKTKHCLAVGALDDAKFTDYEFDLEKGDKLFLYTDGVVEATNMKDELFGFDRMVETLNLYKNKTPKEIIKGVKMKVDEFAGKREQFDDITMLCIELKED
nr:serine/threonine-protein phosphatase [bacterium]